MTLVCIPIFGAVTDFTDHRKNIWMAVTTCSIVLTVGGCGDGVGVWDMGGVGIGCVWWDMGVDMGVRMRWVWWDMGECGGTWVLIWV